MSAPGRTGALAVMLLALLAGCGGVPPAEDREPRTASDLTDADRRARVRLELAAAYLARGQSETALDEVKLALQARADLPEAFDLRGLVYASLGQPRLAEESFQRALQLAPRSADTLHNYGWVLCQQQRYAEADALFQRALEQPQGTQRLRTLGAQGVCLARSGRLPDAERVLSRAYELDPSNPAMAFNLAEVLYRRGEFDRARFYIRRVNAVSGQVNAQTLWLAARIERRLGDLRGEQAMGRQLLERFPQSPEALQYERGRFDD